jgi:hypothetical protein
MPGFAHLGRTMKQTIATLVVLIAAMGAGDPAVACGSGKLLTSDTFDTLRSEWGSEDAFMKLKSGEMVIAEQEKAYSIYASPTYRDVDYCASVKLLESSDVSSSYGGLMFWARDSDHYFTFQITLDGYATVYEFNNDWTSLIDDRKFAAIKSGVGAVNQLRVVTKGRNATLYVNDQKFDSITVKNAPGTQRIGFTVEAPEDSGGKATFAFDNL